MPRFSRSSTALLLLTPTVLLTGLPLLSAHTAAAAVNNPPAVGSTTRTILLRTLTPTYSRNLRPKSHAARRAGPAVAQGVSVTASSALRYTVPAGCSRFDSVVGIYDEVGRHRSASFQVFTGGRRAAFTKVLVGAGPHQAISVGTTPGSIVSLVVNDNGISPAKSHADWAGARFTCSTVYSVDLLRRPPPKPTTSPSPAASAPPVQAPPSVQYLSSLVPTSSSNGYGPFEKDMSNGEELAGDGKTITLNGVTFARGLGVHATSNLRYLVPQGCTRFEAVVGVDDETLTEGTVDFQVLNGASVVYGGATMTNSSPNASISTPVTPGNQLTLHVSDAGDGIGKDHADWADARLLCTTSATAGLPVAAAPAPAAPAPVGSTAPTAGPTAAPTAGDTVVAPTSPTGLGGTWTGLFEDQFSGSSLDATKWTDHEPWETSGHRVSDAWYPVPSNDNQIQVGNGVLAIKARRVAGLPDGVTWTSGEVNSRDKMSIPADATSYTEARLRAPSGNALLPAFWLLGNGSTSSGEGWPINGEIDILEFANNNLGERSSPFTSLWFPKDVYTAAPGTWLNATHVANVDSYVHRPELMDTYHVWGLYRSPSKMEIYIDGVKLATWLPNVAYNGNLPLPPMLFTKAQHIRFSLGVGGGWSGAGWTEPQYQEGDLSVDYVKVWLQP